MMPTGKLFGNVFDGAQDVSILVLLDDAYRPSGKLHAREVRLVSILVLLDDAYRHGGPGIICLVAYCFNPCSSG